MTDYNFAIEKAVKFLVSAQLPYGEFRTEIWQQDKTESQWQFDSSPFATAFILNSLSFLQSDQRIQKIREKGINFLIDEVEDYSLWRYWSSHNLKHDLIPPDLDDTCCISQVLRGNNIEFHDHRDIILNNRNSRGLFYTWVLSTPVKRELHSNDAWVINQEEDICCVVNANTVLYLEADEECLDAIEYLIEVLHSDPEKFYSPFYNHVASFYYALSRIIYNRHSPFDSIKEELIERVLSLQKYDGSFGDEIQTALAVCSLLNCGFHGDNLIPAIDYLIQNQQSDGSWRRIPWYGGHVITCGSVEFTTGFCLEALVRCRDVTVKYPQQPDTINRLFRLVRSQDWWLYKIAPLLTIAYAETLFLQLPPTTATLTTLTALLSIASVAAYGYLLNDICDIEVDQRANKPNTAAQLQPWQRFLLCLLFLGTGFAAPVLTHLGIVPLALLTANYLLPTLYSIPPVRLKEQGIWGILSDAAGAHLVPTLFVAAAILSQISDPPRNAFLFTGIAAAHAFFVGLRGILLHQLWDRVNDLNSGIATFVTQRQPATVRQWINQLVFPYEILLFSGAAILLCQSAPALTAFFAFYLLLTTVNVRTAPHPFTSSPSEGQNIIPHDLYEVWLPLTLAITLAVQNPQFLIFVVFTAILFYPSLKVRATEMFHVIKAAFTLTSQSTPSTPEASHLSHSDRRQAQIDLANLQLILTQTQTDLANLQSKLAQVEAAQQASQAEATQLKALLQSQGSDVVTNGDSNAIKAKPLQAIALQSNDVQLHHQPDQLHSLESLIDYYQQALLIHPDSENLHHQLAEVYYQDRDLTKAFETCQKALHTWPQSPLLSVTLTKIFTRLGFNSNEIESLLGASANTSTLEELFIAFKDKCDSPTNLDPVTENAPWKDLIYLSYQAVQERDLDRALSFCAEAIQREPSLSFPYLLTKYCLLSKDGLLDTLFDLYTNAIQLPRVHGLAYTVFGDILTAKNKIPEAITTYKSFWLQTHKNAHRKSSVKQERTSIDYLVIGMGKAGTSSLFHYLSQHPKIINPLTKDISFFSENFHHGFEWYMAQFPPLSVNASKFSDDKFVTGEVNPWYLGQFHIAERVFEFLPNTKLIVTLRNPVSRAISHFYMAQKLGLEHRSLEQAIESEMSILGNVENPQDVSETYWKTERGYLWFSFYLPFLRKWMSLFPKEQFLIVSSDDLHHKPAQTLNRIFNFLDVENFELVNYPKINQGSYTQKTDSSRKLLFDFFYTHNQELEGYLDRKFDWNDQA